jgi:hypothetical protein
MEALEGGLKGTLISPRNNNKARGLVGVGGGKYFTSFSYKAK